MSNFIIQSTIQRLNEIENNIRIRGNNFGSGKTYGDYIKPPYKLKKTDQMPMDIFGKYSKIDFEGIQFMAIHDWQKYLEIVYGDYMALPPTEKRIPDHNFFYYVEETKCV